MVEWCWCSGVSVVVVWWCSGGSVVLWCSGVGVVVLV